LKSIKDIKKIIRQVLVEEKHISQKNTISEVSNPFSYETPEYNTKSLLGEEDIDPFDEEISDSTIALRNTVGEDLAKNYPDMWSRVKREGHKLDFSYLLPEEEQIKKHVYERAFNSLPKHMQEDILEK
tara:strand:- start:2707 stop:3090 length:384 start_codon:yes stop_codon:yes gene_type:complete